MRLVLFSLTLLLASSCSKDAPPSAADRVREGRLALARGQTKRAQALLRKAVSQAPDRVDARLLLAQALERGGQVGKAEQRLREGVSRRPKAHELWLALGRIRVKRGRFDAAIRAFSRARQLRPEDAEISMELGRVYERHRLWDVARSHYRSVLGSSRPDLQLRAHRRLAAIAVAQGQPKEAIYQLRQALQLAPTRVDLRAALCDALLGAEEPAVALKVVQAGRPAAGKPWPGPLALRRGLALHELGRHREAVAALLSFSKSHPNNSRVLEPLATSLLALKRVDEAYAVGVRALALAPEDPRIQWMMAPLYLKRGLPGPAQALLTKLAPIRAHDPDYWRYVGRAANELGHYRAAQQAFARAVTLRPKDLGLLEALAVAARRAGDYAKAARHLKALLRRDPKRYGLRIHLAIAEEFLGHRAEALRLLGQARTLAPQRPDAFTYLAWISLRSGAVAKARTLALQADRLAKGKSPHALDVLASAEARLGAVKAARQALDRALALSLSPGDRKYLLARRAKLKAP